MQIPNENPDDTCSRLNKYLDGEMPAVDRASFMAHIEQCERCGIEAALHREIENIPNDVVLPKDFSKVVAATAESQVSGLRKRKERKITFAIVAGLGAVLFVVLGANLRVFFGMIVFATEQVGAFANVVGSFLLNLVLGFVVIVKVVAAQTEFSGVAFIASFGFVLVAFFAYLAFTRRIAGVRHVKR